MHWTITITLILAVCGSEPSANHGTEFHEEPLGGGDAVVLKTLIRRRSGSSPEQFVASAARLEETLGEQAAALPVPPELFYPTAGQSDTGACWIGLVIDSAGNLYPINYLGSWYQILPDGTLVRGVDDTNFFATGSEGWWGALSEPRQKLYAAQTFGTDVLHAPYAAGAMFATFGTGLRASGAVALGQGSLSGWLLVVDRDPQQPDTKPGRVMKVRLNNGRVLVHASPTNFAFHEGIATAADGTAYVVALTRSRARLLKVDPSGTVTTFASGEGIPFLSRSRGVAVDAQGNVFWSSPTGINKYSARGVLIATLAPPDFFEAPTAMAFDNQNNLFVVENFRCKRIYKYRLP